MKGKNHRSHPPSDLRARAEDSLGKTRREIAAMSMEDVQKIVHELQVHEIELQMQNEELRRTQRDLEEACERYAHLYDFATCPLLTLNTNGEIREANLAAAALLGVERKRLIRQKFTRFIRPEAQDAFYLHQRQALASGTKQVCELELKGVAGDRLTVWVEGAAAEDPSGGKSQYRISLTDITDSKKAEEILQRSEKDLADFFDEAPIGLQWLGADGTILRANQAQLNLLGYTHDNYVGRQITEFNTDQILAEELLERLAAGETVHNHRISFKCSNGMLCFVLIDASSHWEGDQFLYSSIFTRDITQRVELEQKLLDISQRERERFAQDLHDDVGQLLTATVHLTSALQKKLAARSLPEADDASHVLGLLDQALGQTRALARGLYPVKSESNGLMSALEELVSRTKSLFRSDCHFICHQPVLLEDNTVANHLYRIAQEAVTNAVKHGKAERIEIGLSQTSDRIMVMVKDNGMGLSTRPPKKKGMGLRIMQYRTGIIGGSLVIQKEPAGGTAVICSIRRPPPPLKRSF